MHDEYHNLYTSTNIKMIKMGGTCNKHARDEKCLKNFGWKS